jgi:hypothetical protein
MTSVGMIALVLPMGLCSVSNLPRPVTGLQCGYRDVEEAIMPESSIGLMLMLAVFVGIAMALATRYHTDHPLSDLRRWLGDHHRVGRTHRRH